MKPADEYVTFMDAVTEKIYMSKVRINTLTDLEYIHILRISTCFRTYYT